VARGARHALMQDMRDARYEMTNMGQVKNLSN